MKEGLKRNIYYELSKKTVIKTEEERPYWRFLYKFGSYCIERNYDYIAILKFNKTANCFVYVNDTIWDEDDSKEADIYKIYTAVKNKSEGKEYIDPYKDIPVGVAIKDSTKCFLKQLSENADDFLPYDMSKQERLRTIAEMKKVLIQRLKKHYTK